MKNLMLKKNKFKQSLSPYYGGLGLNTNDFIVFFLVLFSIKMQSQEEPPEIFPPAPTVSELGKYGTYPVNMSTGLPEIKIPLYIIQTGDLTIPVELKYHASGIKVNQQNSWVGMGWSLDTGGLISLEVRDTPDELEPYIFNTPDLNETQTYFQNNPYDFDGQEYLRLKRYSWVKDAYHINLPTVNGSFFRTSPTEVNVDLKFPPDEFSVTRGLGMSDDFLYRVIDKKGIIYSFNDYESSEISKSSSTPDDVFHTYNTPYKSAWLLTKIESPKGDKITYSYGNMYEVEVYGRSQYQTYSYTSSYVNDNRTSYQANMGNVQTSLSKSRNYANKLTKIDFPNGRLRFITSSNPRYAGVYNQEGVYLDKIIVESGNDTDGFNVLKVIEFSYSEFGVATSDAFSDKYRFKLDKVAEITVSTDKTIAEFDYNLNVELPIYDSNSVDYFGYYNGKSNSNLIPERTILYKTSVNNNGELVKLGRGNRSMDSSKMKAGILNKITYPTKGYTVFDYEPNSYYGKDYFFNESYVTDNFALQGKGDGWQQPVPNPYEPSYALEYFSFDIEEPTALYLKSSFSCSDCDNGMPRHAYAKYSVKVNNNQVDEHFIGMNTEEKQYMVGPGNVQIRVEVYGDALTALIDYYYLNKRPLNNRNVEGFGLRVKSITNFGNNDEFLKEKVYDYLVPNSSMSSGNLVLLKPEYDLFRTFSSHIETSCGYQNSSYSKTTTYTYSSSSKQGFENNSVNYRYVTEYEVDSLGNNIGRALYEFDLEPNQIVDAESNSIWLNKGSMRGNILRKEIYNDQNDILIKEENFYEEEPLINSIRNDFKLYNNLYTNGTQSSCETPPYTLSNSSIYNSYLKLNWYKKHKTVRTEYFYDDSGVLIDEMNSVTDYSYSNFNQTVNKIETTTSKGNTIKTEYLFAGDLTDSALIAGNRIAIPLETKIFKNDSLLSHDKTDYSFFDSIYLPSVIYSKKGGEIALNENGEDRKYIFDDYKEGKLIQYHRLNDIFQCVIWGYGNEYPIAKLENGTYTDIANALGLADEASVEALDEDDLALIGTLRQHLPQARLTTYTYDPLVGLTSMTDPRGDTVYYVYDGFNRLKEVRDSDNNLVTDYGYHYKGQP